MVKGLQAIQNAGKEQLEASSDAMTEVGKGFQSIAAEMSDYSKKSLESGSALVEKLLRVKDLNEAITLQSEFAKQSFEGFVAYATKLRDLYANLAKDAFKPFEGAVAQFKDAAK